MKTTYGLGASVGSGPGVGTSLVAAGLDQQRLGTSMLGEAAERETVRNATNRAQKAQAQQAGAQTGAMVGAYYGASFGPWGALAGGLIGALGGSQLF